MASRSNRVLNDHDEIRRWAEQRNASPACVRGTGGDGDIGMLRLDFPGYSGQQSLEHIDWDDWFKKFDERGLSLLVQDQTARGERSNFNKIVSRDTARAAESGRSRSRSKSRTSARTRTPARSAAKRTRSSSAQARKTRSTSARKRTAAKTSRAKTRTRSTSTSARKGAARKSAARKTRSTSSRSSSSSGASRSRAKKATASTRGAGTRARRNTATRSSASKRRASASSSRSGPKLVRGGRSSASSHVLTDHDEIRRWAEERNAAPACVRGTGGGDDPGMIRLDFPGFSGAQSLEHIDWNEWFRGFDENNLALLVQDTTARGQRSNFNKLIGRETAARRAQGQRKASRRHPEKAASARSTRQTAAKKKADRGSTRAHRTESARGRTTSHRRAA